MINKEKHTISFIINNQIIEFCLPSISLFSQMEEFLKLLSYIDLDIDNKEENIMYIYDFYIKTEIPKHIDYLKENNQCKEKIIKQILEYNKDMAEIKRNIAFKNKYISNITFQIYEINYELENIKYEQYTASVIKYIFYNEEAMFNKISTLEIEKEKYRKELKQKKEELDIIKKDLKKKERKYYKSIDELQEINDYIFIDNQRYDFLKKCEKILTDKYDVSAL